MYNISINGWHIVKKVNKLVRLHFKNMKLEIY